MQELVEQISFENMDKYIESFNKHNWSMRFGKRVGKKFTTLTRYKLDEPRDSWAFCNTCKTEAKETHESCRCHACEDWNGCGYPSITTYTCQGCGVTSKARE